MLPALALRQEGGRAIMAAASVTAGLGDHIFLFPPPTHSPYSSYMYVASSSSVDD
jgi:hypothetical protein